MSRPQHLTGIDHCVILVNDLDAASATYKRLGFTLSPRGTHSEHMGSANYTIMLGEDYFELLGIINPTERNQRWRDVLKRGEGLNAIALQTDDAEKACAEIRGMGIEANDPVHFSRPVDMPGGGTGEAAFIVTQFPADATPSTQMFVCGHLTRDTVWIPELQQHANTAKALAAVTVATEQPEADAEAYGRIFGAEAVGAIDGGAAVQTGGTPIEFLTPAALAGRYPGVPLGDIRLSAPFGLSFQVADLGTAKAALEAAGTKAVDVSGNVCVAPADACGTLLEFRAG